MTFSDADHEMDEFDSGAFDLASSDSVSAVEDYPLIDLGSLGVDPEEPTEAKPGSEEKVCMLAARYAAGLPLWHTEDCVDHGPEGADVDAE